MASPAKMAAKQKKWATSFSEEELQVAEILFQLQRPFHDSRSRPFLFWGRKKKRSSIFYPSSSPSPGNGEKCEVVKVDASSPATPLSFSPSDTDSKSKQFRRRRRRAFTKKRNEQLRDIFAALTSQQEQLKYEISKVKDYYDKLRAANLLLKARQFESCLRKRDQFDLNSCKSLNVFEERKEQLGPLFEEKQASLAHQPSLSSLEERQAPLVHQPSANATMVVGNFRYHDPQVKMSLISESGLSLQSNCPYIVLDNNLLLDEAARRDFHCKAAMAAQARKRRIEINRAKGSMAAKAPRVR